MFEGANNKVYLLIDLKCSTKFTCSQKCKIHVNVYMKLLIIDSDQTIVREKSVKLFAVRFLL